MNRVHPEDDFDPRGSYPVPAAAGRLPARSDHQAVTAFLAAAPDAPTLIRALRRRWVLASLGGIGVGLLATVAAFVFVPPPNYTVKAMIHIASTPAKIIFQTSESVPEYRSYQRTQATLAKSRKVLTAALRRPEVSKLPSIPTEGDPASWLDRELKVEFPGGAEIMTIAMTAANAARCHPARQRDRRRLPQADRRGRTPRPRGPLRQPEKAVQSTPGRTPREAKNLSRLGRGRRRDRQAERGGPPANGDPEPR